jgi:hypothetical protein
VFKGAALQSDTAVRASHVVSKIVAKKIKPFSDWEIIKECKRAVADIAFPEKKIKISTMNLSRFTIGRKIEDLSNNTEKKLKEKAANFHLFSLAMDESTDVSNTAQLAIFVPGTDNELIVTEELAGPMAMKRDDYLHDEIKKGLQKLNIPIQKLV